MFLSWWRGLVQTANPKTKTSRDANRWRIPRKFRYAARVEQLEDRVVPATNLFLDVGAATPIVQAMPNSTVKVFIDIGTLDQAGGVSSAQFYVKYDPAMLAINQTAPGTAGSDVQFGPLLPTGMGYQLGAANAAGTGLVGVSITNTGGTFYTGTAGGKLVELDFHVLATASPASSTLLNLEPRAGTGLSTFVTDKSFNNYTFNPALQPYTTGTFTQSGANAPSGLNPADTNAGDATIQVPAIGTTTTVSTSNATPVYGTPVTLTATVTPAFGTVVPTLGSLQFFINGTTVLGSGTFSDPHDANHDILFTYVTTATQLQVGSGGPQALTATYTPGASFAGSTSTNNVTETVTPLTLAVTGLTASDKVYDSTTTATLITSGAGLAGYFSGDTVTLNTTGAMGLFDTKDVGAAKPVTVSGLLLSGAQAADYALPVPQDTVTANVTKKMLTVSGITASDKVYTATQSAVVNTTGAKIATVFAGDTVNLVTTSATGTFDTKDVGTGKTVTISGLNLGGAQGFDYVLPPVQQTTTASITVRTLGVTGITAANKTYDGTTAAILNTSAAALSGVFGGDTVSLSTTGSTGMFDTRDVGTGKTVTISGLLLTGLQAFDYALPSPQPTTTANVTPKTLTVSGITASNKTYDGTTVATLNTTGATLTGVISPDVVTLVTTNATGTFDTRDVGTGKTVTISGLSLTGPQAFDYALPTPQQTTTANITARALTVSGITANDKVYDGTNVATLNTSGATLTGVILGDVVTLVTTGAVGTFGPFPPIPGKDVGTAKTVIVSGLSLTGPQAADYALPVPQQLTLASITPKPLTVTGITATKVYDATTLATLNTTNAALVGVLGSDVVTLDTAGAVGTYANKDVGTNIPITVTGLTLAGAQAFDYMLPAPGAAAPAGVVAYWRFEEGPANGFAHGTNSILDSSGNGLAGTSVNGPAYRVNVGANPIPQTGATNNYALAFNASLQQFVAIPDNPLFQLTHSFTIEAYINLATFQTQRQQILFRGDDQAGLDPYQLDVNGTNLEFMITDATNTSASVTTPFSAFQNKWAFVTASLDDTTGTMSLYINGTLVSSTTTSIRPLGALMAGQNPGLGVGNVQDATSVPEYFNGLIDEVRISNQALQPNQFLDFPPQLTFTTGTITPFTLTVSGITAANKVYDATTTATLNVTNASLTGVFPGDTVTLNTSARVGTFDTKDVGTGKTVTISGLTLAGAQAADYILPVPQETTTANITPRSITGAFTAANKTYDGTTAATITGRSLTGVLSPDVGNVTLTGGTATFSNPNVGNGKTVTGTGFSLTGSASIDYVLSPTTLTTTANITAATLTVSIVGNPTKPYDGTTAATLTPANFSISGLANGDNFTITQTVGTYDSANAGARTVSATLTPANFTPVGSTLASNYTLPTSASGAGTITAKTLTVTIVGNPTKPYDGTTAATLTPANFSISGLANGDSFTITQTVGTYDSANAGARTVSATLTATNFTPIGGTLAGNYILPTSASGAGTITAKTLTVSIVGNPTKPYDGTTAATLTPANFSISGLAGGDNFTVTQTAGTYDSKNAGARTVSATLTPANFMPVGNTLASNYILPTSASGPGTITTLALVGSITAANKVYDTTTTATITSRTLSGVAPGDSVSYVGGTANFADAAVGTGKTVTATGLSLSGPDAANYTVNSTATTTADITPDLVNNPLIAFFGIPTTIDSSLLRADSASNPSTVVFTVVSLPSGTLQDGSVTLTVGSTFTQADINAGNLIYTGNTLGPDSFQFTATDGHGGTVPLSTFQITVIAEVLPIAMIGDISRLEGISGRTAFVFNITLASVPLTPVIYDVFTTDGTAVSVGANPNFVPIFPGDNNPYDVGTVSFARGQVRQTITVYVLAGSIPVTSPPKYFIVSVSNPASKNVSLTSATGTIVPQDASLIPLMNAQRAAAISAAPPFGVPLTATPAAAPATTVAAAAPAATPPVVPVSALSPPTSVAPAPMAPLQPVTSAPTPWVVPLVNTNQPSGSDTTALDMVFSEPWSTNALGNTDVVDQVFAVPLQ